MLQNYAKVIYFHYFCDMKKRILNIATFARLYFEKLGKKYDETDRKQRESADKNFRRIIKNGQLDPSSFAVVKEEMLKKLGEEIDDLKK
jgi:hypothetical protein